MATSRILLISDADDSAVVDALRAAGHDTTLVGDIPAALATGLDAHTVDVIVLDLDGPASVAVEACRALRALDALSALPILCMSQTDDIEDRIQLLEAGVDDVLARAFDPRELDARAEALALRLQRSRDLGPTGAADTSIRDGAQRRLIAVFSPKGGAGTTTIAVNIAAWLAAQRPGAVAILDLNFQFGQVATHLNMTTRQTVADLAADETTLRDPSLFAAALDRHGSGLMVLAAPATPDLAVAVTGPAMATLLTTAATAYPLVVVDAGSVLDAHAEAVLGRATDIVIILTPEFPAIKAVHALSEMLGGGNGSAEISFVLNSIFARELLRSADIEEALGTKVAITIPYDTFAFLKSVNEGVPVVIGAPRSTAAAQLGRLAARVGGLPAGTEAAKEKKAKGLGGLFGR